MSKSGRELHCYDYVNHRYEEVRAALLEDPAAVFQQATASATARASDLSATLRVRIGGSSISRDIHLDIVGIEAGEAFGVPATRIALQWRAIKNPQLFPTMSATIAVFPLSRTETQLDLKGRYQPPLGVVGDVLDGIAGHRLAEAAVLQFMRDVAAWLRNALADRSATATAP